VGKVIFQAFLPALALLLLLAVPLELNSMSELAGSPGDCPSDSTLALISNETPNGTALCSAAPSSSLSNETSLANSTSEQEESAFQSLENETGAASEDATENETIFEPPLDAPTEPINETAIPENDTLTPENETPTPENESIILPSNESSESQNETPAESIEFPANLTEENTTWELPSNQTDIIEDNQTILNDENASSDSSFNQTDQNSTAPLNQTNLSEDNQPIIEPEFILFQHQATVGIPVRWTKTINSESSAFKASIPKDAELLEIRKISEAETNDESAESEEEPAETSEEIPGTLQNQPRLSPNQQEEPINPYSSPVGTPLIPTSLEEKEDSTLLTIESNGTVEITYQTPAPLLGENNISDYKKQLMVYSDFHYTDIAASALLPSETQRKESISLISLETGKPVEFEATDTDSNGLLDSVTWTVPHLSSQTYELSINILNVHSNPELGGNWSVEFTTSGTANLTITATIDPNYSSETTRWSDSSEDSSLYDLRFLEVKCGDTPLPYEWQGESCDQNECSVHIPDFACNQTATETSKVLTAKRHTLKFNFGGNEAFAYNNVSNVSICQTFSVAGENYTLNQSVSKNGGSCFIVSAANVTIDCGGKSITGNNAGSDYAGIYSNQLKTTVKNCNISGFTYNIYFDSGANNGTIKDTNITALTGEMGIYMDTTSYSELSNLIVTSVDFEAVYLYRANRYAVMNNVAATSTGGTPGVTTTNQGIRLDLGSNFTTIANSTGTSIHNVGIYSKANCYNTTIINSTGSSNSSYGMQILNSPNTLIINSTASSNTGGAILIFTSSHNSSFINSTARGGAMGFYIYEANDTRVVGSTMFANTLYAAVLLRDAHRSIFANNTMNGSGVEALEIFYPASSKNNLFINNTFISNITLVFINNSASGNNTFYWNNFTDTSGLYVNDINGSNRYNTTVNGKAEGNIWHNVQNGSVNVAGAFLSGYGQGLYLGSSGTGYPYNNTSSAGKFACNFAGCLDYAPLTSNGTGALPSCGNLTEAGKTYTMAANASINGSTCFTVTATNVTLDCNGFSIRGNNSSSTYGIYSNEDGTIIKNCIISNFSSGITFFEASNGWIDNTNVSSTTSYGIDFNIGAYNNITNSYSASTSSAGVRLRAGYSNMVNSTGSTNSTYGILVESSIGNSLTNSSGISLKQSAGMGYGIRLQSNAHGTILLGTNASSSYSDAIEVDGGSSNVSIDCQGKRITGQNRSGTYGIYVSTFNTTIRNCNISNFSEGIRFAGATDGIIQNNTITVTRTAGNATRITSSSNRNQLIGNTISASSSNGIMIDGGSNTTIDCQGGGNTIRGNNASGYYGIYSTQFNTTVNNCAISNFTIGIEFNAVSNGSISNTNATSWQRGIYLQNGSNYNSISNIYANSSAAKELDYNGFEIRSSSNNTVSNVYGYGYRGLQFTFSAANNTIYNVTGLGTQIGIYFVGTPSPSFNNLSSCNANGAVIAIALDFASNIAVTNCNATGSPTIAAIYVRGSNNTISNFIANSTSTNAVNITNSTNNTISGGKLISSGGAGTLLYVDPTSMSNTFYWNNFTATSGYYANDANGSNFYNTTIGGQPEGNIWNNVLNGSVQVYGSAFSAYGSDLYIGSSGAGYPYNNSTSDDKLVGRVVDYAPLTGGVAQCGNLNSSYTMNGSTSIADATCFNVTAANVTLDCRGYTITGSNASNTYGVYSNQFNTTVKNCIITAFAEGIRFAGATDGIIQNNTITVTSTAGNATRITSNAHRNQLFGNTINAPHSHGIVIDGGSNTTIDCQGASMIGNWSHGAYQFYGIYSNQFNTTIRNCNISNFQHAVYFNGADNGTITNITAVSTTPESYAIYLYNGANYNTISNLTIAAQPIDDFNRAVKLYQNSNFNTLSNLILTADDYTAAIEIHSSLNNTLSNFTITAIGSGVGLKTFGASKNRFSNFTVSSDSGQGVYLDGGGTDNFFSNFNISSANSIGISSQSTDFNTFSNFTINSNSVYSAIVLNSASDNNILSNFTAISVGTALDIQSDNNALSNFTTTSTSSYYALRLSSGSNNSLSSFTATSNSFALYLIGSSSNTISNFAAISTDASALYFSSSSNNNLSNFTVTSNADTAFHLGESNGNRMLNATISSTGAAGGVSSFSESSNNAIEGLTSSGQGLAIYALTGEPGYDGDSKNNIIDCIGGSITGRGTAGIRGIKIDGEDDEGYTVYSTNNTVKNCNISNFSSGVYLELSTNNTILGNNITNTYFDEPAVYMAGTGDTLANNTIAANTTADAVQVFGETASSNIISGNRIENVPYCLTVYESVTRTTISGNNFTNCTTVLRAGVNNSTVFNNTFNGSPALSTSGSGGTFYGNTLISSTGSGTLLIVNTSNNTFYWNNFTNTSGYYVNDTGGSNHYNTSIGGTGQGNYWFDALNRSYAISDSDADGWGEDPPYNSALTSKISGNITDYAPAVISVRYTYPVYTYLNFQPQTYFANNTIVNITSTVALTSAPNIVIRNPYGMLVANETMSGTSGAFYYLYTINGSSGWYNATITESRGWRTSHSYPWLFYVAKSWASNFTDADGYEFVSRTAFNITEPGAVARWSQIIELDANTSYFGANDTALRLVALQNSTLIEIPSQFDSFTYDSNGRVATAKLTFIDSFSANQTRAYYHYYAFVSRPQPNYGVDFSANSSSSPTFQNMHYSMNASYALGGKVSEITSKYSNLQITTNSSMPFQSPEASLEGVEKTSSIPQVSSTNGTLHAEYSATGPSSPNAFFNFSLNYNFYSRVPYFILETNATRLFSTVYPWSYRDLSLSLFKRRFDNVTYINSSGTYPFNLTQSGTGATYSDLQNGTIISFTSNDLKNGIAFILLNSTSNKGYAPNDTIVDSSGNYSLVRTAYTGSMSVNDYFYSKFAVLIYDPSAPNFLSDTHTALLNPMNASIGETEHGDYSVPTPQMANYTPFEPNDTNDITCFSYWSSLINIKNYTIFFNSSSYSVTTNNSSINTLSAWANLTVNSSFLNAGPAFCNITVFDVVPQSNSTLISFTIGDKKPPVFTSIAHSPNASRDVDPNVTVTVYANLTEYTNVSAATLQYASGGAYTDVPMALNTSGAHWFYYKANFTPDHEANYTYRVYANDTLGNSNTSNATILPVFYDWTWALSPDSFLSVGTSPGNTTELFNLTINVTGDYNLSFYVKSNYGTAEGGKIYYNGTNETTAGSPTYNISVGAPLTIPINITARLTAGVVPITFTVTSWNASAQPLSNTSSGTIVTTNESVFLFAEFVNPPTSVIQGQSGVQITAKVTNFGTNTTATGTNVTWILPSGWSAPQTTKSIGSLTSNGGTAESSIAASVSATAATGDQPLTISTICNENSIYNSTATVNVIAKDTPVPPVPPGPSPSPGGGGSGGITPSNQTWNSTKVNKTVEKHLTLEQRSQFFNTLVTYELVRGKDKEFELTLSNPLDYDLENVTINVSGYLQQYIRLEPAYIPTIPAHNNATIRIIIEAPKYFTEGAFTLYFDIAGTYSYQTEDALITTNVRERRTVDLLILEMNRTEAKALIDEAYALRIQMQDAGAYQGAVSAYFDNAVAAYENNRFGDLMMAVENMRSIRRDAFFAKGRLDDLKGKLDAAKAEDFKLVQSMRLYTLAASAFERGDYTNSLSRVGEAELTFELETRQEFSLTSFLRRYGAHIIAGMMFLAFATAIVFLDVRFWMMDNELFQLSKEEEILFGMIHEVQTEYFEKNKLSTSEYTSSIEQYGARLGKIIHRKVELEAIKKNYFKFRGKLVGLQDEKSRLEEMVKSLQRAYLEEGKYDTRTYENRMKSYIARLSEVEEEIAVNEAQEAIRKQRGMFKNAASGSASLADEGKHPASKKQDKPRGPEKPKDAA